MASADGTSASPRELTKVIVASSLGTLIEWYDFYLFGVLGTVLATSFFPSESKFASYLYVLAVFAAGFIVRPFGAIVFGRLGDLTGRKGTFLITLLMMGFSTFAIGLIPTYHSIGVVAPAIMLLLRLIQGLAVGGEYGGAATYVAEHAPSNRRGYFTSFIQTTATLGFFIAILVVQFVRTSVGEAAFKETGWRYPFLLSAVLVIFSYFIRRTMSESPAFTRAKDKGHLSANPLVESFVKPENRKLVILALFGATAGQGVVWYTGQFYALSFIQKTMNIAAPAANSIVAWALILGTPLFIVVGALSDKIGRKKLIMAGCLAAAIGYVPIYSAMMKQVDIDSLNEVSSVVGMDGSNKLINKVFEDGTKTKMTIKPKVGDKENEVITEITPSTTTQRTLTLLVLLQVIFVTLVYGPMAAFLVELFPTHIRYTSMSLPYHLGNGVFGGLVPFVATWIAGTGGSSPLKGLVYPIAIALLTFAVGTLFLKEPQAETFEKD